MSKKLNSIITTTIAAELLGFSTGYIRKLILSGKINAQKIGHDWILTEKDIKHIKRQRHKKEFEDAELQSVGPS